MATTTLRVAVMGLVLLAGGTAGAETRELTWAHKMFDKLSHDFGDVARGADVSYRFKVTNLYKETVHIANVRTTCGCSAAEPSQRTLKSREVAYIDVTMDTRKFIRRKDSNLVVTFDAPFRAEVKIPVTTYIRTDVVLTPGAVDFGAVDTGSGARQTIAIAYAGRDDWTIRDVQTGSEHLSAAVVETGRENGRVNYELRVTLEPTVPVGDFRQQIMVLTDDANSPRFPVLVEARIERDVTVTPSVVSLGRLVPGKSKTVRVVLRGKKPFTIEKVECSSDAETFQTQLPGAPKQVHVLPLTVVPPDEPGPFSEELTVTIAGRAEPITLKAYGTIVGEDSQ